MLEAARPLFATAGFHQVSTGAIVQAAGVSRGALYHQFGGKAALFEQVFEEIEAEVIERISVGVTNSKPANDMEQLRQAVAL